MKFHFIWNAGCDWVQSHFLAITLSSGPQNNNVGFDLCILTTCGFVNKTAAQYSGFSEVYNAEEIAAFSGFLL